MKTKHIAHLWLITIALIALLALSAAPGYADTVNQFNDKGSNWPVSWTPIASLDDPDDGVADQSDFVGDATDPGAYVAVDDNYVYFRVRVDASTAAFSNSIFVLIDKVGTTDYSPDYSFTWDTKSADITKHGLELQIPLEVGSTWATTKMQDIDGKPSVKEPPDFSVPPGTDGYIRTVDNQSTTNFGTTTFIDFAVSWSFLAAGTTLAPDQTWRIEFGSVTNATDHNYITADVAGGTNPTTSGLDWSSPILMSNPPVEGGGGGGVPEPATVVGLALMVIAAGLRRLRKR